MSSEPVSEIVDAPPESPKTNWWLIIGIVAGVLILCTLILCVGLSSFYAQLGRSVQNSFVEIMCKTEYPALSETECSTWAGDVIKNHSQDISECQNSASAHETPGDIDPHTFMQCLDDRGLGPKN